MASYEKRGTGWQFRISWQDEQGKRHTKSNGGFRTKKLAENAAHDLEVKLAHGSHIDRADLPLVDYWHQWYTTYKIGKRAVATEYFYPIIETTLKDYFGDTPLGKITPLKWQSFLNDYGDTHARSTSSKVNGYIRAMVRTAINEQTLHTDFTFDAEISGERGVDEVDKYLQLDQFAKLVNLAHETADFNHLATVAVYVGAESGMRVAEVLGLTWDCVDFEANTLTINKSWDYIHHTGFKPTKNESSNRTVEVLPAVTDLLRQVKVQQAAWMLKTGQRDKHNCVFYSKYSQVLTGAACNKALKNMETKIGIPDDDQITFHGLRHTHVSYLLSEGIEIYYISKRLGHAGIQITMSTYSHLLDAQKSKQASKAMVALDKLAR